MHTRIILNIVLLLSLAGCTSPDVEKQADEADQTGGLPIVYVSNYPLEFFVERIAGPVVDVRFPAAASGDPAYWVPQPEDITEMQTSDLIVLNGASYELWLKNVSLPSTLASSAAGLPRSTTPLATSARK